MARARWKSLGSRVEISWGRGFCITIPEGIPETQHCVLPHHHRIINCVFTVRGWMLNEHCSFLSRESTGKSCSQGFPDPLPAESDEYCQWQNQCLPVNDERMSFVFVSTANSKHRNPKNENQAYLQLQGLSRKAKSGWIFCGGLQPKELLSQDLTSIDVIK